MSIIDLCVLPCGERYEDRYGKWLNIFKKIARTKNKPIIKNAPNSWVSLLSYLGAKVLSTKLHLKEDWFVLEPIRMTHEARVEGRLRELVESHSALRPELVDSLYKSDVEWETIGRVHQWQKEFVVTCNGSFYRPEVLKYINETLPSYKQTKKKCVLLPCAADKPYPAPLHKAVRKVVPRDYELIIATGVLGIVPESLWSKMPLYDSGLPNEWRLMHECAKFFGHHWFDHIIVYCDFYSEAIERGLLDCGSGHYTYNWDFVNPVKRYENYLDLMSPHLLDKLRKVVRK